MGRIVLFMVVFHLALTRFTTVRTTKMIVNENILGDFKAIAAKELMRITMFLAALGNHRLVAT